jgi:lysine-N-methylase
MPETLVQQQSHHYPQFRCIGAACEDTCCDGWQVSVDQKTYEKYQQCSHPELGPQLQQWVQIQPAAAGRNNFARIALSGSRCPFLSEQLCSIQKELGEDHLGRTCATFPRIHNRVAGVVERSLDLSCPEAARLLLTDPSPASFHQVERDGEERYDLGADSSHPHPYFWEIRSALLSILQDRRYPVAKRLVLMGHVCDKLSELAKNGHDELTPQVLDGFAFGIDAGLYDHHLQACSADAADQLNIVLQLMAARIQLDFTPPRYRDLYGEFVDGLQLKPGLSMKECSLRYAKAYTGQYAPFLAGHEHMLEHYLVYYAYKNLFPFGSPALNAALPEEYRQNLFTAHYLLMTSYFAVAQSLTVGLAARYGSDFGPDHAIRCIQSCSRTLEHCTSYPSRVFQILAAGGIKSAAGMSVLTQSPQYRERGSGQISFFVVAGAGR